MNANELADYLDSNVGASVDSDNEYIDKASAMLRQQQAEIESLKNRNWDLVSEPWGFDRKPADLTDEEIQELAEYHGIDSLYETGRLDFAKAILRKAQER